MQKKTFLRIVVIPALHKKKTQSLTHNGAEGGEKVSEPCKTSNKSNSNRKYDIALNYHNQDTIKNMRIFPYHSSKNWIPY